MTIPEIYSISDDAFIDNYEPENLLRFSQHGFSYVHLCHRWTDNELMTEKDLEELQSKLDAANLKVLDVHGSHPNGVDVSCDTPEEKDLAFKTFRNRLKITHALGADAMVYHIPGKYRSEGYDKRYIDGLERLEEEARALGIVIALENLSQAETDRLVLSQCFEKFDPAYIGFTLDPGHGNLSGNLHWLLDNCMDRLTVLHLNDNEATQDKHWLPFQAEGSVDWEAVIDGIARSPYQKPLQLEVKWYEDKHDSRDVFMDAAFASINRIRESVETRR